MLDEDQQDDIAYSVGLLAAVGSSLGFLPQFEDQRVALQQACGNCEPKMAVSFR